MVKSVSAPQEKMLNQKKKKYVDERSILENNNLIVNLFSYLITFPCQNLWFFTSWSDTRQIPNIEKKAVSHLQRKILYNIFCVQ